MELLMLHVSTDNFIHITSEATQVAAI